MDCPHGWRRLNSGLNVGVFECWFIFPAIFIFYERRNYIIEECSPQLIDIPVKFTVILWVREIHP